jgi:hypothetical protein
VASEQEELRLIVSLDAEQATAQLRQLQEQMKSLGTGAQAAGTERLQRGSRESAESIKLLNTEMTGLATRLGFVGGFVGGITRSLSFRAAFRADSVRWMLLARSVCKAPRAVPVWQSCQIARSLLVAFPGR